MEWSCKYCSFLCQKKSRLLQHYRTHHFHHGRSSSFPCLYNNCLHSFSRYTSLTAHLSKCHNTPRQRETKLQCMVCSEYVFNICHLLRHIRKHAVAKQVVSCPFNHCAFQSSVASSFSAHVSRNHRSASIDDLRGEIIVNGSADVSGAEFYVEDTADDATVDQPDTSTASSWTAGEPVLADDVLLERELLRLFVKMTTVLHVPRYAVQEIIAGLNHVHELSEGLLSESIKNVCIEHNIPETLSDTLAGVIVKELPFSKLTEANSQPRGSLSSAKLRDSAAKRTLPYVDPVEYDFGYSKVGKHCKFVYVPILNAVQNQLKRPDILQKVLHATSCRDEGYHSFRDGSIFKDFRDLDSAHIHLTLYTDEWESVNPIGTSRKEHKINAFYWVFTNIESKHRSAVHTLQLATLARYDDVRSFGFRKYLHPLLNDLAFLEKEGVYVESLGCSIKGTVSCIVADNLGAHSVGGFVESFGPNVAHPCRFCTASSEDIQNIELTAADFRRRCREDHNLHVKEASENNAVSSTFGVKTDCVFHEFLNTFHVTSALPPDISHDLLEGVVPVEIALCLNVFVSKGYFTVAWLNGVVKSFPFKFKDAVNRPHRIPENFSVTGTVGGNATENWTLLRLLPILIGTKVPAEDEAWCLLMELKDIVELCFAPSITEHAVGYLSTKIIDHKRLYKKLFPDKKLKPKHHFLEHYPDLIREFGPLADMWTMRFESKHSYFKRVINESHCFKNILKTMADKHQLLVAFHLSSDTYFTPEVCIPDAAPLDISQFSDEYQLAIKKVMPNADEASLLSYGTINGMRYAAGMVVVTGFLSGLPELSEIVDVMLLSGKIFLVVVDSSSWYSEHIRGFFVESTGKLRLIEPSCLHDYYPLSAYKYNDRVCVMLKHFIYIPW